MGILSVSWFSNPFEVFIHPFASVSNLLDWNEFKNCLIDLAIHLTKQFNKCNSHGFEIHSLN